MCSVFHMCVLNVALCIPGVINNIHLVHYIIYFNIMETLDFGAGMIIL